MGDILLPQEEELARIRNIAEMERELSSHLEHGVSEHSKKEGKINKMQQEKKRKREEDEDDNVEEEIEVEDGEKVFISSRTGRQHYQKVVQEMQYIKGLPVSSLITMMIE